jgi:hypothetical protein
LNDVRLDFEDLHIVDEYTNLREVEELPRAVSNEGVILVLHGHLPVI